MGINRLMPLLKMEVFLRISRYYPQIGYNASLEIEDENIRKQFQLGKPTPIKPLEATKVPIDDFISLDMTVFY